MSTTSAEIVVTGLSDDEIAVVVRVAQWVVDGMRKGRPVYGPLDLADDERDWAEEARQELRDGIIYAACAAIRSERLGGNSNG